LRDGYLEPGWLAAPHYQLAVLDRRRSDQLLFRACASREHDATNGLGVRCDEGLLTRLPSDPGKGSGHRHAQGEPGRPEENDGGPVLPRRGTKEVFESVPTARRVEDAQRAEDEPLPDPVGWVRMKRRRRQQRTKHLLHGWKRLLRNEDLNGCGHRSFRTFRRVLSENTRALPIRPVSRRGSLRASGRRS